MEGIILVKKLWKKKMYLFSSFLIPFLLVFLLILIKRDVYRAELVFEAGIDDIYKNQWISDHDMNMEYRALCTEIVTSIHSNFFDSTSTDKKDQNFIKINAYRSGISDLVRVELDHYEHNYLKEMVPQIGAIIESDINASRFILIENEIDKIRTKIVQLKEESNDKMIEMALIKDQILDSLVNKEKYGSNLEKKVNRIMISGSPKILQNFTDLPLYEAELELLNSRIYNLNADFATLNRRLDNEKVKLRQITSDLYTYQVPKKLLRNSLFGGFIGLFIITFFLLLKEVLSLDVDA